MTCSNKTNSKGGNNSEMRIKTKTENVHRNMHRSTDSPTCVYHPNKCIQIYYEYFQKKIVNTQPRHHYG